MTTIPFFRPTSRAARSSPEDINKRTVSHGTTNRAVLPFFRVLFAFVNNDLRERNLDILFREQDSDITGQLTLGSEDIFFLAVDNELQIDAAVSQ